MEKYKRKLKKLEVIYAETAEAFERDFNRRMRELFEADGDYLDDDPAVEFVHEKGFCAYITYQVLEDLKPRTVKDAFHLEGVYFHCRNCHHLQIPDDRRVKYGMCKFHPTARRHRDAEACELFYKWIANNETEPISCAEELFVGENGEIRREYVREVRNNEENKK